MAFAKGQFELEEEVDGMTLRSHLEAVQRQTGRVPEALANRPSLPDGCGVLWSDYMTLRRMAGSNGFGPSRVTLHDIDGFQRVNQMRFAPWEIDAITRADGEYLAMRNKETGK